MLLAAARHQTAAGAQFVQTGSSSQMTSHAGANNSLEIAARSANTATPIKHLIVIVGENHTFDSHQDLAIPMECPAIKWQR
jgi:phospholipase C